MMSYVVLLLMGAGLYITARWRLEIAYINLLSHLTPNHVRSRVYYSHWSSDSHSICSPVCEYMFLMQTRKNASSRFSSSSQGSFFYSASTQIVAAAPQ
jgi:hypothetical protein